MPAIPPSAETSLNMTPMIDIVFNLVTFFMMTLDLSKKELAVLSLPQAHNGVQDDPQKFAAERRITINLTTDGAATVRGQRFPFAAVEEDVQAHAISALREEVVAIVATERVLAAGKPEPVVIFVRGDREVPWRRVQWVMQACADPRVHVERIVFAVEGPDAERERARQPASLPRPERRDR